MPIATRAQILASGTWCGKLTEYICWWVL